MRQQRTKDTGPERELRSALHARGLRFRLHRQLIPGLRRTSDIVFPGPRVVVDVRGCFWHGCPDHSRRGRANAEWWDQKMATNIRRDAETERLLTEAGWLVLVVWEHDAPDDAAERVRHAVQERRRSPHRV